jgi:hypothetical protein
LGVALCLLASTLPAQMPSNQLLQGTQMKLVLLQGISTSVARDGDPFVAVVAEPVYYGGQLVLPAGARVHGVVGSIQRPKRFAIFRGQAAMNLQFRSIEIDRREVPAQMSILSIHETSGQANTKTRKDIRVEEGAVVEAKADIKGDVTKAGVATGGGTLVGAIFSHAMRGFVLGLVGGTTYVLAKKGREVELPAQTGLLVRLDNTVTLPTVQASAGPYVSGQP